MQQERINTVCQTAYESALDELLYEKPVSKRLRCCNAVVYETTSYFVLRSYSTVVAVISKATDACFDVLRSVYGYTATSAQHIAKFAADYGNGKRYTWRDIPRR